MFSETLWWATSLNHLQMVQNAAARMLTGANTFCTFPILALLHWLLVSFRIQLKMLLIVFKALDGQAPSYISDLILFNSSPKSLRSAYKALLYVFNLCLKVTEPLQ